MQPSCKVSQSSSGSFPNSFNQDLLENRLQKGEKKKHFIISYTVCGKYYDLMTTKELKD